MSAWLQEIARDPRSHRDIASDPSLEGVRLCMPKPFALAVQTIGRNEGWRAETLMAPVLSNVGWCERPGLRLFTRENEIHGRAPVVQIFVAGDPSMRKSSLKEYTSRNLLASDSLPEVVRTGDAVATDATMKGIRSSIANYERAGIVSDEVSTTYAISTRVNPGLHPADKDLAFRTKGPGVSDFSPAPPRSRVSPRPSTRFQERRPDTPAPLGLERRGQALHLAECGAGCRRDRARPHGTARLRLRPSSVRPARPCRASLTAGGPRLHEAFPCGLQGNSSSESPPPSHHLRTGALGRAVFWRPNPRAPSPCTAVGPSVRGALPFAPLGLADDPSGVGARAGRLRVQGVLDGIL